jgi:hypothetical protein
VNILPTCLPRFCSGTASICLNGALCRLHKKRRIRRHPRKDPASYVYSTMSVALSRTERKAWKRQRYWTYSTRDKRRKHNNGSSNNKFLKVATAGAVIDPINTLAEFEMKPNPSDEKPDETSILLASTIASRQLQFALDHKLRQPACCMIRTLFKVSLRQETRRHSHARCYIARSGQRKTYSRENFNRYCISRPRGTEEIFPTLQQLRSYAYVSRKFAVRTGATNKRLAPSDTPQPRVVFSDPSPKWGISK